MITASFTALLFSTLMVWLVYGWVCLGYGWTWVRLFRLQGHRPADFVWAFWVGFGTLLALLHLWQLRWPINGYAYCLIVGAGLLLSLRALPHLFNAAAQITAPRRWTFLVLCLALAFWIADRAAGPGNFYDAGLYHIPAMQWASQYAIVPGLANLHIRLGFTSSMTLLSALMNQGMSAGNANHVMNGFLLSSLAIMIVRGILAVLADAAPNRPDHWIILFGLFVIGFWTQDPQVCSLSTDIAPAVFMFCAAAFFLRIYSIHDDPQREQCCVFACITLCAMLVSAKIGTSFFAAPLALGALWHMGRLPASFSRRLGRVALACSLPLVIFLAWEAHQIILSGYPLFPSPVFPLPVNWRVPLADVITNERILRDWARSGDVVDTSRDFSWINTWIHIQLRYAWNFWEGPAPFSVGALSSALLLILRRRLQPLSREWRGMNWLLIATFIAIGAWFVLAPDPRFSPQLMLFLACSSALLWAKCLQNSSWPALRLVPVVFIIALALGPAVHYTILYQNSSRGFADRLWESPGPENGFHPAPSIPTTRRTTIPPDVVVYLPATVQSDQVWDAPLPNTPYQNDKLRLRQPPDLQEGFRMEK